MALSYYQSSLIMKCRRPKALERTVVVFLVWFQISAVKWMRTALFWAITQRVVLFPYRRFGNFSSPGITTTCCVITHKSAVLLIIVVQETTPQKDKMFGGWCVAHGDVLCVIGSRNTGSLEQLAVTAVPFYCWRPAQCENPDLLECRITV